MTSRHLDLLRRYAWPGNIRELQNVIERAVILARGGPLRLESVLPADDPSRSTNLRERIAEPAAAVITDREFRKRERQNLLAALAESGWKIYGKDGAASRMRTLRIERPRRHHT